MAIEYDHWIETKEITQAVGGVLRYAARPRLWEIVNGAGRDVPFREFLGRTAEEAETKAQAELDTWLAQRKAKAGR